MSTKGASQETVVADINALKLVRESLENEIRDLHIAKANLSNQQNQLRKELHEATLRKNVETNRLNDASEKDRVARETRLYNLEKNLEVIQRQLSDREVTVAGREGKVYDAELRASVLKQEALAVEKMKLQAKEELQAVQNRAVEVDAQIAIATSLQEDANAKLRKAQEYRDSVIALEARLIDKELELKLREKSVGLATEALAPKLSALKHEEVTPVAEPIASISAHPPANLSAPIPPPVKRKPGRPKKAKPA